MTLAQFAIEGATVRDIKEDGPGLPTIPEASILLVILGNRNRY
jgi:hypothetical protein